MDSGDRQLWSNFAEAQGAGARAKVLVESWEQRLSDQPSYLRRWLATTTLTDPEAVRVLFSELGWWPGPRSAPLSDPGRARQQIALERLRRAATLFSQTELAATEEREFGARFVALSESTEGLLWKRTSEATFLALCKLLGLWARPAPIHESPQASRP
jgi:hypothetical protein